MEYIKRTIEHEIKEMCGTFAVVALTGPRQAGKSTTLKRIFKDKYRYISLDDPEIRAQAVKDPMSFIDQLEDFWIIDEAQYSPDLFSAVKMRVDSDPSIKGRFILSGSQQFLLMKSITESLAGRVGMLSMYPLSMDEMHKTGPDMSGEKCFYTACSRSTYPEPFVNHKIRMSRWFESYIRTYVQRDIRSLYNIGKLGEFEAFIKMLAAQAGQVLNLSRHSNRLGVSVNTVKSWLSILRASGIIYILNPYYRNILKQLTKNPKVFFVDTGLLCSLTGIETKEQLKNSPLYGSIFENYCIIETIKFFSNRYNGRRKDFYFLRDQDRLEIDLIIESNNKLYPIEIKASAKNASKAAADIEKLVSGYKKLPFDRGYVLSLTGELTKSGVYTATTGLDEYFKILDELNT
jgi:uncharacterized protein